MRPLILFVTAATLLQACDMTMFTTQPVAPPVDLSSCSAEGMRVLIGREVSLLPDGGGWSSHRVIYPGQAVTQDFSPTRLNLYVNADGIVQSLNCG